MLINDVWQMRYRWLSFHFVTNYTDAKVSCSGLLMLTVRLCFFTTNLSLILASV